MHKNQPVNILAFDTSSPHCAVALWSDGSVIARADEAMQKGQAERLMFLCEDVLRSAGRSFQDLTALGVGIGPGNFTGIRISVSAARGLALGLGIPAVGVSGLEALRFGHAGPCATTITARRGQLYFQRFDGRSAADPIIVSEDDIPDHDGPLIGASGQAPLYPIAEAIARLAADRYRTVTERPAPLYLRPADAAPARDAPPVILP